MANKIDSRQVISRDTLSQIATSPSRELDDLLRSVNSELQMPLRMAASTSANQILNISNTVVTNPETNRRRTIPHISSTVTSFISGTITFPTVSGNNITFSTGGSTPVPMVCTTGKTVKILIYLDAVGNLGAAVSPEATSEALAVVPPPLSGTFSLGYIVMFNSSGTISPVANTNIYQFVGGGGGSGSGDGASVLDPNYDETFIYYTRSDFTIDKKTFFGSTTGTDQVLGFGKVVLDTGEVFTSSNLLGPQFLVDAPVVNTAQVRLLYASGKLDNWFFFDGFSGVDVSIGDVYSLGGKLYTATTNLSGSGYIIFTGSYQPAATGTMTKVSGDGGSSASISYTSRSFVNIQVSADGGSSWVNAYNTTWSGLFVVADFAMAAGTTSTDFRIRVTGLASASELKGFGVNLVQDNVGEYGGDAAFETRIITSTEASTGLITLTEVKFTPGAHQLHCNYSGHDFMAPDFIELGSGQVQFPLTFFNAGDVAKFYVGYGLINKTDAPVTINNMLSSNSTLGSVAIPAGFTLDKPWMEIPAGATVSGSGNVETTGVITGAGILATTGSVLSTGYEPTQPKYDRIEEATAGKGVNLPNGISLGSGSALLSHYEEGSFVVNFNVGIYNTTTLASVYFVRVGKMVTLNITGLLKSSDVTNNYFATAASSVPSRLLPLQSTWTGTAVYESSNFLGGILWVDAGGAITFIKYDRSNFAATGNGLPGATITYRIY